jgi:hypothetical protein
MPNFFQKILPPLRDYHLMFRTCLEGGRFSDWRELPLPHKNRQIQQTLNTLSIELTGTSISTGDFLRIPCYQALRRAVVTSSNHHTNNRFQFAIIESHKFKIPKQASLVFVSPIDTAEII